MTGNEEQLNHTGQEVTKHLQEAIQKESKRCQECYLWLKKNMPPSFFENIAEQDVFLIAHSLMGFEIQEYFSDIHLKEYAIVLCLDSPDADLRILENYQMYGIKDYGVFVSIAPPPFCKSEQFLRVATIYFTQDPTLDSLSPKLNPQESEIRELVKKRNPDITDQDFNELLSGMSAKFCHALKGERLVLALDMFFRAQTRDNCQYEVRYQKNWHEDKETPSTQIVLAWKNTPKNNFLYNVGKVVFRHKLAMRRVSATYIAPHGPNATLIMSLGLHGASGNAAWEEANLTDFLQELVTLKYFGEQTIFEEVFVDPGLCSGNMANLLKSTAHFIHQTLVHADPHLYSLPNIEEGLCRHPELTIKILDMFEKKFHPEKIDTKKYELLKTEFFGQITHLDTGNEANDLRRYNILHQAINFIDNTKKTNFYRNNKTALSFRLDPQYLEFLPYPRDKKFPELPYGIFFVKGMYFIGFHIRFTDLARGGLRTIFPQKMEQMLWERNNVFSECYNLALTQQKKNKDIPEGGSKGVIFLEPYQRLHAEEVIYEKELLQAGHAPNVIEKRLEKFRTEQKLEYLHQAQRSYIESFVTLLNCEINGTLRAKHIVDYYQAPEYIYLGPDENMHNVIIDWIAAYAKYYNYTPGESFITSKPTGGINHKEFGVTSLTVNTYMDEVLKYLGFNPKQDVFTIKISGGPDGDVAGNQIVNLYKHYPQTAKLLALTDVSGTIYDPEGLDLPSLYELFQKQQSIHNYPVEKLNEGGFLLNLTIKRDQSKYSQQTLCSRKKNGKVHEEWLSGNEMNHIFRNNVHTTKADIFIPCGGRPRTLNENNWRDFLDDKGVPTSKAIVEGANLYLTPAARSFLEQSGVLIIKDSSANKGGVTCSSLEVLCRLCLTEKEFIADKTLLMPQILNNIKERALLEAQLLLVTHAKTNMPLTEISDKISQKINQFKYQLLEYLTEIPLPENISTPLMKSYFQYAPKLLVEKYKDRLLEKVPDLHKKAIMAAQIASRVVYTRGLDWSPSIVDILPLIVLDSDVIPEE